MSVGNLDAQDASGAVEFLAMAWAAPAFSSSSLCQAMIDGEPATRCGSVCSFALPGPAR